MVHMIYRKWIYIGETIALKIIFPHKNKLYRLPIVDGKINWLKAIY